MTSARPVRTTSGNPFLWLIIAPVINWVFVGEGMCAVNERKSLETGTWKVGVARQIITPEKAVWLAGYGSKRVPEGKLHELWMKALALEDAAGNRAILITSDFQGIPRTHGDGV